MYFLRDLRPEKKGFYGMAIKGAEYFFGAGIKRVGPSDKEPTRPQAQRED